MLAIFVIGNASAGSDTQSSSVTPVELLFTSLAQITSYNLQNPSIDQITL
jgi:hypothetical protein